VRPTEARNGAASMGLEKIEPSRAALD